MRRRDGATLLELLAALTLGGIVVGILGGALVAQLRLARHAAQRTASTDAIRTASAVLQGELRRATRADVRGHGRDSIAVRAFRGVARICERGHDAVLVLYRGDRLPDVRKDSLLHLDGSGAARPVPLLEMRYQSAACPAAHGETQLLLRVPAPAPDDGVLLAFESGTYYVSTRAMRYRLGAEGRQPLTPELFDDRRSGFGIAPTGARLTLITAEGVTASTFAPFAP